MKKLSIVLLCLAFPFYMNAQTIETGENQNCEELEVINTLTSSTAPEEFVLNTSEAEVDTTVMAEEAETPESLLPQHYLFTQKWLWGENGSKRKNGKYPLTIEGRDHEMDIRENRNKWHRIAGYTAIAGMAGAAVFGQMTADGKNTATYHQVFLGVANIAYFTALDLAIFSPPPMHDRESGLTTFKVHQTLAIVHLASMLATDILGAMIENNRDMIPYHRAAAITAITSLLAAEIVINF